MSAKTSPSMWEFPRFTKLLPAGIPVIGAVLFLSGCTSVRYLTQAAGGQLAISNHSRPIEEVLKDERTDPYVRGVLARIPEIKKFGQEQGLKPTKNYEEFTKLDRPAAVWVVSASEPLRFVAREWSFPIVGSFTYLGWFELGNAKDFAARLGQEEKLDVDVRGASAYSTLGWFRDPVLSTMIPQGDDLGYGVGALANVILHESVHATFYLNGQSYFNESVASFVADRMTPQYLAKVFGEKSAEVLLYLQNDKESELRQQAFGEAYRRLDALYSSAQPVEQKLAEKARILGELRTQLGLKREINNATLIQFRTYGVGEKEFSKLFETCSKSWLRFWTAIRTVTSKSFMRPQQEDIGSVINTVAEKGCPAAPAAPVVP